MLKKQILSMIIIILIILTPVLSIGIDTIPVWKSNNTVQTVTTNKDTTVDLKLESASGIVIEQNSGKILYEHNIHEKLRPASVTKVMSILLILEAIDDGRITLEDKVPCSETARGMGGSQIWLNENEELTVHEMLKAICVVSANDCTVAMAEFIAGSEEMFVKQMNDRAKSLGMNDTNFINSHGIDEEGHVTSAYDIALMSRELLKNHPMIIEYTKIWMDTLRDGKSELVNTNKLVRNYSGATGLKTGSTSLALFNLSASATRDNMSLIAVIMKGNTSDIRFNEAKKLLDYGFSNYTYKKIETEGENKREVSVLKGVKNVVEVTLEEEKGVLVKKGEEKNILENVILNKEINAPVRIGDKLGEILYTVEGAEVLKVNLVAKENVNKLSIGSMVAHVYNTWFRLMR